MPVRKRLPKSQGYKSLTRVDGQGREYFVYAGGLPDKPLGDLATDAERAEAMRQAALPHQYYTDRQYNED